MPAGPLDEPPDAAAGPGACEVAGFDSVAVAVGVAVALAVAITVVAPVAAAAGAGSPAGGNIVNGTTVAITAAAMMSPTTTTAPLRDFACGSAGADSSAADPSVAYDCAFGGGSDTRAVS